MLDVNLGAISRLESIAVQSHGDNTQGLEIVCKAKGTSVFFHSSLALSLFLFLSLLLFILLHTPLIPVFPQDLRNPRFAYKKEGQSNLEVFETLSKYTFPLSHNLVRLYENTQMCALAEGVSVCLMIHVPSLPSASLCL